MRKTCRRESEGFRLRSRSVPGTGCELDSHFFFQHAVFRRLVVAQSQEHWGSELRRARSGGAMRPLRVLNLGDKFRFYPRYFAQGFDLAVERILLRLQLLQ